jgi:predicted enzyme related to lactoylglutathione lyase
MVVISETERRLAVITHVTLATLPVRDQDKALDFFVSKLGMAVRTDQPYGPGTRWIEVAPDGSQTGLVLFKVDDDAAYAQPLANVLLGCDDVAATTARLREAGVDATDPQTEHWGTFTLVTEPDGRQICVTQNDSIRRPG